MAGSRTCERTSDLLQKMRNDLFNQHSNLLTLHIASYRVFEIFFLLLIFVWHSVHFENEFCVCWFPNKNTESRWHFVFSIEVISDPRILDFLSLPSLIFTISHRFIPSGHSADCVQWLGGAEPNTPLFQICETKIWSDLLRFTSRNVKRDTIRTWSWVNDQVYSHTSLVSSFFAISPYIYIYLKFGLFSQWTCVWFLNI